MHNLRDGSQTKITSIFAFLKPAFALILLVFVSGCASPMSMFASNEKDEDPFLAQNANIEQEKPSFWKKASLNTWGQEEKEEPAKGSFFGTPLFGGGTSDVKFDGTHKANYAAFVKAKSLFDAGKYKEAQKIFYKVVKENELDEHGLRKRKIQDVISNKKERAIHYTDNPLREDSMFMYAECHFAQKLYPGAEANYQKLLKDYPTTRHIDSVTGRLYSIAGIWMNIKPTKTEDIKLVGFTEGGTTKTPELKDPKSVKRPAFFNFTDRSRPSTDTEGRALDALKAIWINDPTGELADDALMLTASHYVQVGKHSEAAETYRLLRDEYSNSPYVKDAYVLGSHVTQVSYQGPTYDDTALEEAKKLKERALRLFPDISPEQKTRLEKELQQINHAEIAREYDRAVLYFNKKKFEAVKIYCNHILHVAPASPYANKARALMASIDEERGKNSLWSALSRSRKKSVTLPPTQPKQNTAPQNTNQNGPIANQNSNSGRVKNVSLQKNYKSSLFPGKKEEKVDPEAGRVRMVF